MSLAPPPTSLSFFPAPQPDELLDSMVYRYHKLSGYPSYRNTMHELLGKASLLVPKLLTNRLGHLFQKLPSTLFASPRELISRHLLLPALTRIYDHYQIQDGLRSSQSGINIGMDRLYFSYGVLVVKESMSCCPLCVEEEYERLRFAYWHRSHQLHGVSVCHIHGCDLLQSCPYCGRPLRNSNTMDLPHPCCLSCGKRWLPTFSAPASVRRLAGLAHEAVSRDHLEGTDLYALANLILNSTAGDTAGLCAKARKTYGPEYFRSTFSDFEMAQTDWVGQRIRPVFRSTMNGPMTFNFRRYSDLLMVVDTLFGSWEEYDQCFKEYRRAA